MLSAGIMLIASDIRALALLKKEQTQVLAGRRFVVIALLLGEFGQNSTSKCVTLTPNQLYNC